MASIEFEEVNFCMRCGQSLELAERFGRMRPTCGRCGWIYFADPKVAVAALIEEGGRVLLARRVNDPARGRWTLPAGFIDAGENPEQATERECLEETGLQVRITRLLGVVAGQEHARGAHLLIAYQAQIVAGELSPGDDVDQVGFFDYSALPPLAFTTTRKIMALAQTP
jgi:ADP-ribose pyrophosphatase YjhB (NUDIX family)